MRPPVKFYPENNCWPFAATEAGCVRAETSTCIMADPLRQNDGFVGVPSTRTYCVMLMIFLFAQTATESFSEQLSDEVFLNLEHSFNHRLLSTF